MLQKNKSMREQPDSSAAAQMHIETPSELVLKRFLRNKLAIVGLYLLLAMILFSVIGPYLSPYGEYQIFYRFNGVFLRPGPSTGYPEGAVIREDRQMHVFEKLTNADGEIWYQVALADNRFGYIQANLVAQVATENIDRPISIEKPTSQLKTVVTSAPAVTKSKKPGIGGKLATPAPTPLATPAPTPTIQISIPSTTVIEPVDFYATCITSNLELTQDDDITRKDITVHKLAPMNSDHWLGTDRDGRDVLTRLMYGGRISLQIGIIVVFLELAIGITIGGIAGYYRKWIDSFLMRIVDIFNCIPTIPIMLITASVMMALKVNQTDKIYYLMAALGIFGWPGTARIVRGQILSLREMEYMVAAEAVGLKVSRRIFKHLVPNVMPQLIVIATLGIGGTILTESALSFLGMGLSFPFASWGNMVNAVNEPDIMANHLNIWIPPGLLILLTVMSFNFVGDGLRDAFDPKMKR